MLNELQKLLSKQMLSSICTEITMPNKNTITFKPKYTFHKNKHDELYMLQKTSGGLFMSDSGVTLANLDDVFELGEPDIIKNIVAILRQFGMAKTQNIFFTKIDPEKPIIPQMFYFIQGINFLYSMKIFYI